MHRPIITHITTTEHSNAWKHYNFHLVDVSLTSPSPFSSGLSILRCPPLRHCPTEPRRQVLIVATLIGPMLSLIPYMSKTGTLIPMKNSMVLTWSGAPLEKAIFTRSKPSRWRTLLRIRPLATLNFQDTGRLIDKISHNHDTFVISHANNIIMHKQLDFRLLI